MSYRYQGCRDDSTLRERLLELARAKPRFGYRRLWMLLVAGRRDTAERIKHKRMWRVYRDLGSLTARPFFIGGKPFGVTRRRRGRTGLSGLLHLV